MRLLAEAYPVALSVYIDNDSQIFVAFISERLLKEGD
jgi:hypothetical protein